MLNDVQIHLKLAWRHSLTRSLIGYQHSCQPTRNHDRNPYLRGSYKGSANERWCYIATSSLVGWARTQIYPCISPNRFNSKVCWKHKFLIRVQSRDKGYWILNYFLAYSGAKETPLPFFRAKWHLFLLYTYLHRILKTESRHDANFVTNCGTGGCNNENFRCHQSRQSWHHYNSWVSVYSYSIMSHNSKAFNMLQYLLRRCRQLSFYPTNNECGMSDWF